MRKGESQKQCPRQSLPNTVLDTHRRSYR
jgi:hypothetical protein